MFPQSQIQTKFHKRFNSAVEQFKNVITLKLTEFKVAFFSSEAPIC